MTTRLTIGQLAQRVGVPTSTVRYYERRKLLRPVLRGHNRYRYYDEASVERLRLIRSAQTSGFSLDDIAVLLRMAREGGSDCRGFTELTEERLREVEQALADLTRLRKALSETLRKCDEGEQCRTSCVGLDDLQTAATH